MLRNFTNTSLFELQVKKLNYLASETKYNVYCAVGEPALNKIVNKYKHIKVIKRNKISVNSDKIEKVFNTGTTFSINYERFQSLNESGHYDTLFFKFGHISEEDAELALNFNPLQNYDTNLSYKRNINGFDITFGSNYTLMSEVPDYDVNLKISNKY